MIRIGLIGDPDPTVTAHRAIPVALSLAADALGVDVEATWLPTDQLAATPLDPLAVFDALWCVPASPYRDTEGALRAIRFAREERVPFLGTCGGFQHAVLEFARNVLGIADAAHEELSPGAEAPVVSRLSCALVEVAGAVRLVPGSRVHRLCGRDVLEEGYHCSFGFDARYEAAFAGHGFRVTGRDPAGEARVMELDGPSFYVGTLFQPERAALRGEAHPLVQGLVAAARGA